MVLALTTHFPDDIIPPFAQVHMLGRGLLTNEISKRRSGTWGRSFGPLGRSHCKGCLRLFPLNTASVVPRVVGTAAAALGLFLHGTTLNAQRRVSKISLRVAETLSALALQWALWTTFVSTDTRRPLSSVIDPTLKTSGPRATGTMK